MALFVCAVPAQTQELPRIAVYVTGGVPENEKSALGTRMLASLINSGRYMGIERSSSFLAEIDKEQLKQRSGAIDDGQISELGKQFGVKFVCIAAITPVLGDFQVSARIVNVETAQVSFIGESISPLKTANDLMQAADDVVKNMFGGRVATIRNQKPTTTPPAIVSSSFTDSRDGKKYRAVKIGSQTWMAENLNCEIGNSWCYNNDESNCNKYGRLYDWSTAKNACPNGWILPSVDEWDSLADAAGGKGTAGKKLKSTTGWGDKKSTSGNGTDEFGFSALPGGHRLSSGRFYGIGYHGYWWSSTEYKSGNAYIRNMRYNYNDVNGYSNSRSDGFSVRCVKN